MNVSERTTSRLGLLQCQVLQVCWDYHLVLHAVDVQYRLHWYFSQVLDMASIIHGVHYMHHTQVATIPISCATSAQPACLHVNL
jgi:hypothetical protein